MDRYQSVKQHLGATVLNDQTHSIQVKGGTSKREGAEEVWCYMFGRLIAVLEDCTYMLQDGPGGTGTGNSSFRSTFHGNMENMSKLKHAPPV